MQDIEVDNIFQRVRPILQKYRVDLKHIYHVMRLSNELFIELKAVHRLEGKELHSLLYAAALHDIGHFISERKHHRHSHYLILNEPMLTYLSIQERELVARISLNHRKARLIECEELSDSEGFITRSLIGMLRIADVLDYYHLQKTAIEKISIQQNKEIAIQLNHFDLSILSEKVIKKVQPAADAWQLKITLITPHDKAIITP